MLVVLYNVKHEQIINLSHEISCSFLEKMKQVIAEIYGKSSSKALAVGKPHILL